MELQEAPADAQQLAADRTHESRMDEYLRSLGFYRKKIAKDGSCLFRAVAEQVRPILSFIIPNKHHAFNVNKQKHNVNVLQHNLKLP